MTLGIIGDEIDDDLFGQINFCMKNKIHCMQIRTIDKLMLHEISKNKRDKIFQNLQKNNIRVDCILSKIGKKPIKDVNLWVELLKNYIFICKQFQCTQLRIFGHGLNNFSEFKKILEFANQNHVLILIENETNTPINSIAESYEILTLYNFQLKLLFDPGNLFLDNENFIEYFYYFKKFIRNIHIKELGYNKNGDLVGKEIKKGIMNCSQLLEIIKNSSYKYSITLEAHHCISNIELKKTQMEQIYNSFLNSLVI